MKLFATNKMVRHVFRRRSARAVRAAPDFDGFSEGPGSRRTVAACASASSRWRSRRHPPRRLPGRLGHVRGRRPRRRAVPAPAGSRPSTASGAAGPIETVNTGVVGYNTIQELARLEQVGLAYQPDVVVLTFVVNDLLETFSIFDHQYEPTGLLAGAKVWLRRNSHLYRFVQQCTGASGRSCGGRARGRPSRSGSATGWRSGWRRLPRSSARRGRTARSFLLVLYPDNLSDPVSPGPVRRAPDHARGAGAVRRPRAGAAGRPDGGARRRPRSTGPPVPAARRPPPEPGGPPRDRRGAAGPAARRARPAGESHPSPRGATCSPTVLPRRIARGGSLGGGRSCLVFRRWLLMLLLYAFGTTRVGLQKDDAGQYYQMAESPAYPGAPAVHVSRADARPGRPLARRPGRSASPW